jgi:hypothetical protein
MRLYKLFEGGTVSAPSLSGAGTVSTGQILQAFKDLCELLDGDISIDAYLPDAAVAAKVKGYGRAVCGVQSGDLALLRPFAETALGEVLGADKAGSVVVMLAELQQLQIASLQAADEASQLGTIAAHRQPSVQNFYSLYQSTCEKVVAVESKPIYAQLVPQNVRSAVTTFCGVQDSALGQLTSLVTDAFGGDLEGALQTALTSSSTNANKNTGRPSITDFFKIYQSTCEKVVAVESKPIYAQLVPQNVRSAVTTFCGMQDSALGQLTSLVTDAFGGDLEGALQTALTSSSTGTNTTAVAPSPKASINKFLSVYNSICAKALAFESNVLYLQLVPPDLRDLVTTACGMQEKSIQMLTGVVEQTFGGNFAALLESAMGGGAGATLMVLGVKVMGLFEKKEEGSVGMREDVAMNDFWDILELLCRAQKESVFGFLPKEVNDVASTLCSLQGDSIGDALVSLLDTAIGGFLEETGLRPVVVALKEVGELVWVLNEMVEEKLPKDTSELDTWETLSLTLDFTSALCALPELKDVLQLELMPVEVRQAQQALCYFDLGGSLDTTCGGAIICDSGRAEFFIRLLVILKDYIPGGAVGKIQDEANAAIQSKAQALMPMLMEAKQIAVIVDEWAVKPKIWMNKAQGYINLFRTNMQMVKDIINDTDKLMLMAKTFIKDVGYKLMSGPLGEVKAAFMKVTGFVDFCKQQLQEKLEMVIDMGRQLVEKAVDKVVSETLTLMQENKDKMDKLIEIATLVQKGVRLFIEKVEMILRVGLDLPDGGLQDWSEIPHCSADVCMRKIPRTVEDGPLGRDWMRPLKYTMWWDGTDPPIIRLPGDTRRFRFLTPGLFEDFELRSTSFLEVVQKLSVPPQVVHRRMLLAFRATGDLEVNSNATNIAKVTASLLVVVRLDPDPTNTGKFDFKATSCGGNILQPHFCGQDVDKIEKIFQLQDEEGEPYTGSMSGLAVTNGGLTIVPLLPPATGYVWTGDDSYLPTDSDEQPPERNREIVAFSVADIKAGLKTRAPGMLKIKARHEVAGPPSVIHYTVLILCSHTVLTTLILCSHTVLSYCALVLCSLYSYCAHTVLSYFALILCSLHSRGNPLYSYCALILILCSRTVLTILILCSHTVLSYCALVLCSLRSYCALILCSHTVLSYCAHCTHTVLSYCALILCSHTVLSYTVLSYCAHYTPGVVLRLDAILKR